MSVALFVLGSVFSSGGASAEGADAFFLPSFNTSTPQRLSAVLSTARKHHCEGLNISPSSLTNASWRIDRLVRYRRLDFCRPHPLPIVESARPSRRPRQVYIPICPTTIISNGRRPALRLLGRTRLLLHAPVGQHPNSMTAERLADSVSQALALLFNGKTQRPSSLSSRVCVPRPYYDTCLPGRGFCTTYWPRVRWLIASGCGVNGCLLVPTIPSWSRSVPLTPSLEVDRAIDNLVKSGKMFGMPGRRESMPLTGPAQRYPEFGMSSFSSRNSLRRAQHH